MAADGAERESTRARLIRLAVPQPTTPGWVPSAPPGQEALSAPDVQADRDHEADEAWSTETDQDAPAQGVGRRALDAAITTYTAAHGHPLDHPAAGREPVSARWAVRTRVAVAASLVLLGIAGLVVMRSVDRVPSTVVDTAAHDGPDATDPEGASEDPEGAADGALEGALEPDEEVSSTARSESSFEGAEQGTVVVHVVGQVTSPGVVSLGTGARVADAIEAAGGATTSADVAALNLARIVVDGEQVLVPRPGEVVAPAVADAATGVATPGSVASTGATTDLNAADLVALDDLPGIGPVLAQRIVDWRDEHGRFSSVEELGEVSGIGPALLADLRDLVRV